MTETTRQPEGQWCWCDDPPEGQPPHDCAEDHATRPACQCDGAHVHPRSRREQQPREHAASLGDDLEEMAGIIHFRVGAWEDFGYKNPPTPESAAIPPLGKRSANAIRAGHGAVQEIDRLIARLHEVRARLVSEMRQDEDIRMAVPVEEYEHEPEWDSADSNAYQDRVEAGLEPEDSDG